MGLQLARDRTAEWQRLDKLLEGALAKLSSAVWSLAQSQTARRILEAIADGGSDPGALAALTSGRVTGGRAAVAAALEGMQVRDHHRLLIRTHLDRIALPDRQGNAYLKGYCTQAGTATFLGERHSRLAQRIGGTSAHDRQLQALGLNVELTEATT